MTSEATLYEDAQIDAAVVTALNDSENAPFWRQAYGSAIRRIRSMSILAGNGEPSLREVAALLDNDTVLEALAQAGAARSGETERERDSHVNQDWLENEWRPMDHGLRNHVVEGIRPTAASRLTVTGPTGETGAPTIGERRGPWLHDGRLRWDIYRLPTQIRAPIGKVIEELNPAAPSAKRAMQAESNPMDSLRPNMLNMTQYAVTVAYSLNAITLDEGLRLKNQIAEWRARLPRPRAKGRSRRKARRRTTADTNRDRTVPTAPAAAE